MARSPSIVPVDSAALPISDPAAWGQILRAGQNEPAKRRGSRKLPQPTNAMPGTPEKKAVLEARHRRGELLWDPDNDPRWDLQHEMVGEFAGSIAISAEVERNGAVINRQTAIEMALRAADAAEDSFIDELLADLAARRQIA